MMPEQNMSILELKLIIKRIESGKISQHTQHISALIAPSLLYFDFTYQIVTLEECIFKQRF